VSTPGLPCRSVDCVQAALTLLMLAKCLGRYRPRTRGLFPLRWQKGRWLTWVAAGDRAQPQEGEGSRTEGGGVQCSWYAECVGKLVLPSLHKSRG
jgi:hypothetical protein